MISYQPIGLRWRSLVLGDLGMFRPQEAQILRRLGRIFQQWDSTPYVLGQCKPRVGTYCTAFVCAVLDELYRQPLATLPDIPHDAGMHDRETAMAGLRWFLRRYPNHGEVTDGWVQPGDVLVTGPRGGGPGHAILVGTRENTLWQCSGKSGVHFTGMALPDPYVLFAVYRMTDRLSWS